MCKLFQTRGRSDTTRDYHGRDTRHFGVHQLEFCDWVSFRSNAGLGEVQLGRWLGVTHRVGRLMSYWILPECEILISAMTVQRLTNAEQSTDEVRARMRDFERKVKLTLDAQ